MPDENKPRAVLERDTTEEQRDTIYAELAELQQTGELYTPAGRRRAAFLRDSLKGLQGDFAAWTAELKRNVERADERDRKARRKAAKVEKLRRARARKAAKSKRLRRGRG